MPLPASVESASHQCSFADPIASSMASFWLYATARRDLVVLHLNRDFAKWVAKIHASPILVYAVAIGIAGWKTSASLVLFALVPLFFILPSPLLEGRIGAMTRVREEPDGHAHIAGPHPSTTQKRNPVESTK